MRRFFLAEGAAGSGVWLTDLLPRDLRLAPTLSEVRRYARPEVNTRSLRSPDRLLVRGLGG